MDSTTALRRMIVVTGVLWTTSIGLMISVYEEKRSEIEDIKIVYVPEDDRGPVGPPGAPSRDQMDEAIDKFCADGRCDDRP